MQIVVDYGCAVKEYVEQQQCGEIDYPRPAACPECGHARALIGHGYYVRKALDQEQVYRVGIKRWVCRVCHGTVSLLPSFLLRFRHYLVDVIQAVLVARFEQQRSWRQIVAAYSRQGAPASRTLRRWCQSYAAQAVAWLSAVEQTLAVQASASPWLDAQGEAGRAANAGQALLQASRHLLAWAQGRWPELSGYGRAERLHFLWHWGWSQGLERLI